MKIVLIQPRTPINTSWEATSLGYLKAYAELHGVVAKWEFYSGYFDSDKEILEGTNDADYVGFSCTTPQIVHAKSLVEQICFSDGHPIIIMGGVHPSAQPKHTLQFCDHVVKGEGEDAFLKILRGNDYNGIVQGNMIEPLDDLPPPDRRFIKQERNIEVAHRDNKERIGAIFSSRGCPYRCVFCSSRDVWGMRSRLHSPERVFCEMRELVRQWDIDFIKFSDDTFTVNEKRVWELCNLLGTDFKAQWGCNIRANTSENLLRKMKESGCREVWIGAESGDDGILSDMKKGITVEQVKRIFKTTKEVGMFRRAYFMIGMPNDSWETIERTKELAREIDADQYGFSIYCALPNNSLWKDEYLETRKLEILDEYTNPYSTTKYLSNEELQKAQKDLVREFQGRMCWRQRGAEG